MVVWKRRMFHTDRGSDPDFDARGAASTEAPTERPAILGPVDAKTPELRDFLEPIRYHNTGNDISAPCGATHHAVWRHIQTGPPHRSPKQQIARG